MHLYTYDLNHTLLAANSHISTRPTYVDVKMKVTRCTGLISAVLYVFVPVYISCTNTLLVQLTTSSCVFATLSVPLNCSAVLCAQPECDDPITPPGQCCLLCPVDGDVDTTATTSNNGINLFTKTK